VTNSLTADTLIRAPKVLLHDHLDGGVRPGDGRGAGLRRPGYEGLPTTDVGELSQWFYEAANSGSLERYLETFAHTVGVMQTPEALRRIAAECAEDLARDGVVYAEVRYAPELHVEKGMELAEVVEAVNEGFREGRAPGGRGPATRSGSGPLLTAMRHAARSMEIAELVVRYRDEGVAGFDIAGAEAGHPPTRHLDAFEYLQRENAHFTIHAGEGFGLPSIWQAIQWCGADRLGHGVRIIDDIQVDGDEVRLGRLAAYVRDKRIPLEMAPTSNVMTGAAKSIADHPIGLLRKLYFRVTINTDNRLMSGTTMTAEFEKLAEAFGYDLRDFQWFTVNAMKSAFIPFDQRLALIDDVIKPGYAALQG
jgi:adenosine deaminase